MRKIGWIQIFVFAAFLALSIGLGVYTAIAAASLLPLPGYREIVVVVSTVLLTYAYALICYRTFLRVLPLHEGEIPIGSRQEFIYHVYLLFYLMLFYPVMRSGFVPVPVMRVFYLTLGAKLGANTYASGIILDPQFVEIGDNSIVGQFALLIPHIIEGTRLAHYPIRIGNDVTIGAGSTVLSGVTIGNDAIVSTGAVVKKGTQIGDGEIWGGIPAKLIGRKNATTGNPVR